MAIDRLRTVLVPSVGKRIASGFAVVLTLLVVLVAVTFRLIVPIDAGAARVRADSAEAEAAAVVALQVGDAHARVVRYALSGTMADQKAATDSLGTLDEAIATATATHLGDASGLVARVARYRVSVDETFGPVTRRLAAIERIHTAGTEIRTITSAIAELLDAETDADLVRSGLRLAQGFQEADAAASRFLASRNPADLESRHRRTVQLAAGA